MQRGLFQVVSKIITCLHNNIVQEQKLPVTKSFSMEIWEHLTQPLELCFIIDIG